MAITRIVKGTAPVRDTHTNWNSNNPTIPEGLWCCVYDRIYSGSAEWFVGRLNNGIEMTYRELVTANFIYNFNYKDDKGQRNGLASLDSRTKIPIAQIPITYSSNAPTNNDGKDGDLWITYA